MRIFVVGLTLVALAPFALGWLSGDDAGLVGGFAFLTFIYGMARTGSLAMEAREHRGYSATGMVAASFGLFVVAAVVSFLVVRFWVHNSSTDTHNAMVGLWVAVIWFGEWALIWSSMLLLWEPSWEPPAVARSSRREVPRDPWKFDPDR